MEPPARPAKPIPPRITPSLPQPPINRDGPTIPKRLGPPPKTSASYRVRKDPVPLSSSQPNMPILPPRPTIRSAVTSPIRTPPAEQAPAPVEASKSLPAVFAKPSPVCKRVPVVVDKSRRPASSRVPDVPKEPPSRPIPPARPVGFVPTSTYSSDDSDVKTEADSSSVLKLKTNLQEIHRSSKSQRNVTINHSADDFKPKEESKEKKSRLFTAKRASVKASQLYETLSRKKASESDGGGSLSSSGEEKHQALLSQTVSTATVDNGGGAHLSLEPVDANTGKWKRSAEAEAILRLIQESSTPADLNTADSMHSSDSNDTSSGQSGGMSKSSSFLAAPADPLAIDDSAIRDILGIEDAVSAPKPRSSDDAQKALDPLTEIKMTEASFINDIVLLIETFLRPVRQKELLPVVVIEALELNIDRLLSFHRELYCKMQYTPPALSNSIGTPSPPSRTDWMTSLLQAFDSAALGEMERIYAVYMGHYETALALFYEKRDSLAPLRKFLKQREDLTDKSIPNLLVTPVQRVCKYELMLTSIVKQYRKENAHDASNRRVVQQATQMESVIANVNRVLQNVDRRRAAADCWDQIQKLQSTLLVSESLATLGRTIVANTDCSIRVSGEQQDQPCKLVLFNDIIIRSEVPKNKKKARLLDNIPLSQLLLVDPVVSKAFVSSLNLEDPVAANSAHVPATLISSASVSSNLSSSGPTETYQIYIVNSDPRGEIWLVSMNSQKEKDEWLQHLRQRIPPFEQFLTEWGMGDQNDEALLAAETVHWPQEYVPHCRLFVLKNYLCLSWMMFGHVEHEKVPFSMFTTCKGTAKSKSIQLNTKHWKQSYTFHSLHNYDLTKKDAKPLSSIRKNGSSRDAESYVMQGDAWDTIWTRATTQTYKAGMLILKARNPTPVLYKLVSGSGVVATPPGVKSASNNTNTNEIIGKTLSVGKIFGVSAFLSGGNSSVVIKATSACTVKELSYDTLFQALDTIEAAKFFGRLAMSNV